MPHDYPTLDWKRLKTYSIAARRSLVHTGDFAQPWQAGGSLRRFIEGLPGILAGAELCAVIDALADAHRRGRTVVFAMGAHVIKVGLNPVVIDLMRRGLLSAVAMNGAGIVHDMEVALVGQTSENVAGAIEDGSFGMVRETCQHLNAALELAAARSWGIGRAVGEYLLDLRPPQLERSILAAGARLGKPVTVHVAFGTDIIHMHPDFDAAAAGAATHRDFQQLAAVVATLSEGVYLNVGSAVILPEVFLKALSVARNLGFPLDRFTAVNLDFMRQYRPLTNVVARPTAKGGRGINLVGHHEIMVPLIAAGVIDKLALEADR